MSATPLSLLQRLQQPGDQAAWQRFVDLYSPQLFLWGCRAGLQGAEAADLVRGVFVSAAKALPSFRAGLPGGFRGWMRDLAQLQRRELLQKRPVPAGGAPVPPAADALWEAEYLTSLLRAAVAVLQPEFPAADWKAYWGTIVEGRPIADVARELKLTAADVHLAEARTLRRLRQELDGLLD